MCIIKLGMDYMYTQRDEMNYIHKMQTAGNTGTNIHISVQRQSSKIRFNMNYNDF